MEPAGKQEKTKYKLAASMKECMKQMPVDKITVKNKLIWNNKTNIYALTGL